MVEIKLTQIDWEILLIKHMWTQIDNHGVSLFDAMNHAYTKIAHLEPTSDSCFNFRVDFYRVHHGMNYSARNLHWLAEKRTREEAFDLLDTYHTLILVGKDNGAEGLTHV